METPTGFEPLQCHKFPNVSVDSFPTFTPYTYQNWRREVKLWIDGQRGAAIAQMLAKLIHIPPLAVKTESVLYRDQTDARPQSRTIETAIRMSDGWFGRTDSGRSFARLTKFTESKRGSRENYKAFWARFARVAGKLEAHGVPLGEK